MELTSLVHNEGPNRAEIRGTNLKSTFLMIKFHSSDSIIKTFPSINRAPIKIEIKNRAHITELKLKAKQSNRGGGKEPKTEQKSNNKSNQPKTIENELATKPK